MWRTRRFESCLLDQTCSGFEIETYLLKTTKMKEIKYCPECNEIIKKHRNVFCNSSCAAKYNCKGRKYGEETKNKISIARKKTLLIEQTKKCVVCNNNFILKRSLNGRLSRITTCSNECHSELKRKNQKNVICRLIENGTHKGWEKRNIISYPERFFIDVLNSNNIQFEHNYPIKQSDLGANNQYNYFLDFFICRKKIDLEIDGKQHNDRMEHDVVRDKLLLDKGYVVYRIKWKSINTKKGSEYMKNEVNKFLEFYKNI
jgi:hypothetical protein